MKIVYKLDNGMEFETKEEAQNYENFLKDLNMKRIKYNLQIYLANKSRLKEKLLSNDQISLNNAWTVFKECIPINKFQISDLDFSKKFLKACQDLEIAALQYKLHIESLKEARKMIPRLNAAIKAGEDFCGEDLFREPSKI